MRKTIGIVGAGVAGLTAAHLLRTDHAVTVFEKSGRVGGNAFTYRTRAGDEADIAVAAFGRAGYPTFYKLLRALGVETALSRSAYMSFHNLDTGRGLYLTPTLRGLVAQNFHILMPGQLRSLGALLASLQRGLRLHATGAFEGLTVERSMDLLPHLRGDARIVFLGALCLMSSMGGDEVLAAPADFFFGKLATHSDVISPRAVYSIRTVRGHTKAYVEALSAPLRDRIEMRTEVVGLHRDAAGSTVVTDDGTRRTFDAVVLACPADQALALLAEPTDQEARLLGAWRYRDGRVVVHRDHTRFPPWHLQQAHTFLYTDGRGGFDTSVNAVLRFDPGVSRSCDLVSSQHPNFPIDPGRIEFETVMRAPVFDFAAAATIDRLPTLNGVRGTWYCGSYFGHGLHEDAVRSAVQVARGLGVRF